MRMAPTRAQITHALERLMKADRFQAKLQRLNHAAETHLMDALSLQCAREMLKLTNSKTIFFALQKLATTSDLAILAKGRALIKESLPPYINALKKSGGPKEKPNLGLLLYELLNIYCDTTGLTPTHSDMQDGDHTGIPLSHAGKFAEEVTKMINSWLTDASLAPILSTMITSNLPGAVRRFKEETSGNL